MSVCLGFVHIANSMFSCVVSSNKLTWAPDTVWAICKRNNSWSCKDSDTNTSVVYTAASLHTDCAIAAYTETLNKILIHAIYTHVTHTHATHTHATHTDAPRREYMLKIETTKTETQNIPSNNKLKHLMVIILVDIYIYIYIYIYFYVIWINFWSL
jgi:hypothetical protein